MLDIIQNYSPIYGGILAGILFSIFTIVGIVIFDPLTKTWIHGNISSNEIIGITLDGFTAIYGILLGLLAVGAYENVNAMEDIVSKEATNISVLYRDFRGYPESVRRPLENELKSYAKEVVEVSWPQQALKISPSGESKHIDRIFDILVSVEPKTKGQEILHTETLSQFNSLMESRRSRIANLDSKIPEILWWLVGLGAIINILLICLLDFERRVHFIFGGTLSFYIGVMIFIIASMDSPFAGSSRVSPDAIKKVLESPTFLN
jgi:Protein of unknown function (DUF4239)